MKHLFSILVLTILLWSCSSETKPLSFETTEIPSEFDADISASYDKATGADELSKIVNFKIEEAIISTLNEASKKTNLNTILENFNTEYLEFKNTFGDNSDPLWELYIETEKIYQSEAVITIAISTYEFKGGAHGNDKIKFLNLDAKTGDVLEKKDIIKDIEAFKKLAEKQFIISQKPGNERSQIEDYFFGKSFQLPDNIGFSEDGFVLLYNTYEVESYDQGYTEFIIPFDLMLNYLKVE